MINKGVPLEQQSLEELRTTMVKVLELSLTNLGESQSLRAGNKDSAVKMNLLEILYMYLYWKSTLKYAYRRKV